MPLVKSHYWRLIIDQLFQTATKNGIFIPFQCSLCGGRTDDLKGQNSNTWSYCPSVRVRTPASYLPSFLAACCVRAILSFVRLPPAAESKAKEQTLAYPLIHNLKSGARPNLLICQRCYSNSTKCLIHEVIEKAIYLTEAGIQQFGLS